MAQGRINPTIISIIVIVLIGAGAAGVAALNQLDQTSEPGAETSQTSTSGAENQTNDTSSETNVTVYTDGAYTAEGSYSTPGGSEDISVTATLTDGVITDITATGSATGGNSAQYQRQFLSGYKSEVVGKSIDEVKLSRVAGSSLTSTGFNRALDTIKNDAKS